MLFANKDQVRCSICQEDPSSACLIGVCWVVMVEVKSCVVSTAHKVEEIEGTPKAF